MAVRGGIHTLVVTVLLLFFTVVLGLSFGAGLQDRVAAHLELVEGELVAATMVYRGRHVACTGRLQACFGVAP